MRHIETDNFAVLKGGGLSAFIKKSFIFYLVAVTGCTTAVQEAAPLPAAKEQSVQVLSTPGSHGQGSNSYKLPSMDLEAQPKDSNAGRKSGLDDILNRSNGTPSAMDNNRSNVGKSQGSEEFENLALGMLSSASTKAVKDWFSVKHATAELNVSAGRSGTKTGSFDILMPIFDSQKDLFFTQLGVRRSSKFTDDYRTTVNLGVGYRKTFNTWLLGINSFYDRDLTGKNDRLGVGAEAMADFLKLSANGYLRLSDWKKSPDLDNYLERPSNGFDLRAEAYLPSYPQLGGKLIYEKYYGNDVGLFGASERQKDPSAVTVGVTYNPVPMIGIGVDHRQGQGVSDNTLKLSVNYQFDVPLAQQLSSQYVANHRLENARYSLVSRNNEIVLDYKKAEHANLSLPAQISGTPTQSLSFPVNLSGGRIANATWTGTASSYVSLYNGSGTATLTLPAYSASGLNSYSLQLVATDVYGEVVQSNVMNITVQAFQIALARSVATAAADGQSAVTFTATLEEPDGTPRADTAITWAVQGQATVESQDNTTNSVGRANLRLVSRYASTILVSAKEPQGATAENAATFTADPTSATVTSLTASPPTIAANGSDISTLTATIKDANGITLVGAPVTWTTSSGILSSSSTVTDSSGLATVTLKGTLAGTATVRASAVAGNATTTVSLSPDVTTAKVVSLTASPASITANGTAISTLTGSVTDANGNAVGAGVNVNWSTTSGTLSSASSITNASGVATVTLKGTTAGTATVTGSGAAGSSTATVTLVADSSTARVVGLSASPTSIVANGSSTSTLTVLLQDAYGNAVGSGITVTWATNMGSVTGSSTTNASGYAYATLTSGTTAGTETFTAYAPGGSASGNVTFTSAVPVASSLTASNTYYSASSGKRNALAVDINNSKYVNDTVSWTISSGTATSYDVLNSNGVVLCSSTGTSCAIPDSTIRTTNDPTGNNGARDNTVTIQLRANYNGTSSIIYSSTVQEYITLCSGDCGSA